MFGALGYKLYLCANNFVSQTCLSILLTMSEANVQQRDTEAMIMQAAEKEFLEKGYAGAKTASIAGAAGVTHAMFHYYFRTKDKLFEKIVSDKMTQLSEIMFGAIGNSALPLRERIIQGVSYHFEFLRNNPLLPRFIINELYINPERFETIKNAILSIAAPLLANMQATIDAEAQNGRCRRLDARMILLDIVSLNLFPFLASPIVTAMIENTGMNQVEFLEKRKQENIATILNKLNIQCHD